MTNQTSPSAKPQTSGRPKKASREQIIQAALVVMENVGFAALSMRALAKQLGINHATIYNYFDNIDALEQAALDELMTRIPMPDTSNSEPMRQQLIEHLIAVRQTQLMYPKFCHAPAGTSAWKLHMSAMVNILSSCCDNDEQIEDVAIAYNALISLVATNAERTRVSGRKAPVIADIEALAALPREQFEPLFRPLLKNGAYSKKLSSFVYRINYLIDRLIPHLPTLTEKDLEHLHEKYN